MTNLSPVDWELAERVAVRAGGREPFSASYLADSLQAASDENQDVRLTALWSLAGIGATEGIGPILKATAATESWPRRQAVRAALLLADNLAAAGKSRRILEHLKERGEPHLAPALGGKP